MINCRAAYISLLRYVEQVCDWTNYRLEVYNQLMDCKGGLC